MEIVYLRKAPGGTGDWMVCTSGDSGAVAFVQEADMDDAVFEAVRKGYADGARDAEMNRE